MYIRVRVNPGAKKEKFTKIGELEYEIFVKEKAERNLANGRIRVLIARNFKVSESSVRIANGHRGAIKLIKIQKV